MISRRMAAGGLVLLTASIAFSCSLSWQRPEVSVDDIGDVDYDQREEVVPHAEICNAEDDDLDGLVDEDFACIATAFVTCLTTCGSEGSGTCDLECHPPDPASCMLPPERCNGIDDDCQNGPDDPFDCEMGVTESCTTACGSGNRECGEDCRWGPCIGTGTWYCEPGRTRDCSDMLDCGVGTQTCDAACQWGECGQATRSETCNGRDDDCDTTADEGLLVRLDEPDKRVTFTRESSLLPFLVWTGSEFFVSWVDGAWGTGPENSTRQVMAARLNDLGAKVGADIPVTSSPADHMPAMPVLASTELAVVYGNYLPGDSYDLYMNWVSFGGELQGEILLAGSPGTGSIAFPGPVWSGLNYGIAWQDTRSDPDVPDIYFQIFDSSGGSVAPAVNLTGTPLFEEYAIRPLWTGSEYLVVFDGDMGSGTHQCQLARVSSTGEAVGEPLTLVAEGSQFCIPSWIDSTMSDFTGFGMSWQTSFGTDNSDVHAALFNPDGTPVAGPITIQDDWTQSNHPMTIFNPDSNTLAISWIEQSDLATGGECMFAEASVDPTRFERVTPPTYVSASTGNAWMLCAVAWTGSEYGFVWQDWRDPETMEDIYFNRVGCP
jgi:hypothetical protein